MKVNFSTRAIGILVLVALIAGAAAWRYPWNADEQALHTLYGNVDIREVQLAFRTGGRIESMLVEEGDTVVAGEVLAHLDTEPLQLAQAIVAANVEHARAGLDRVRAGARPQEIQQAKARVREAQAAYVNAAKNADRQDRLLTSRSTSQTAADAADAIRDQVAAQLASAREALELAEEGARAEDIAAARASLLTAQAQLAQAQMNTADATLRAPSDGIILVRAREPGSLVTAGQPVYALALTDKVYVRAYVNEPMLGDVAPGTSVSITTDSSDRQYTGRIGFVSPRAEFTPKSVETPQLRTDLVYRLRILVLDSDAGLRQGMPVTVSLPPSSRASAPKSMQSSATSIAGLE